MSQPGNNKSKPLNATIGIVEKGSEGADDDEGGAVWKAELRPGRRASPVRLTSAADQYANPAWSRDGSTIAMTGTRNLCSDSPRTEIFVVPSGGGPPEWP